MTLVTPTNTNSYTTRPAVDEHSTPNAVSPLLVSPTGPEVQNALAGLYGAIDAAGIAALALVERIYPVCVPYESPMARAYDPIMAPYASPLARVLFEYTQKVQLLESEIVAMKEAVQV